MLDPRRELPFAEPTARPVRLRDRTASVAALAGGLLFLSAAAFAGEAVVAPEEIVRALALENLVVQNDRVAGVIVNTSSQRVRDVKLRIVFSWLWADEHRQGTDDPSFAVIEVVHDEIQPQGNLTFGYSYPSAMNARTDGRFLVEVRIIGFSTITESRQVY
jgi:hypothetical protein